VLPPVNPWDVVPSEPVESTGWANFENFENSLSIENTTSENKKPCDELKEKIPETTATNLIEKTSSDSAGDGNEKNKDLIASQGLPVTETNVSSSKINEDRSIPINEAASTSELSVNR
jgi:hypothetical protein